jgi:3-oxoacyl-[acyl-carrier protein] reductase
MIDIKDSVAVITGGASGLGLALGEYWVQNGGKVVLADISEKGLGQASGRLKGPVATVVCDVTREEDCARLADTAIDTYGQINMVAPFAGIINDGLMLSTDRETGKVKSKMSLGQFQSVVDINLTGVFLTIRECAERMIDHHCRGLICLVSSTGSLGTAGQINYSATKAGVSVMPKVITAEFMRRGLADRIRCVAIAPGFVRTPILENMSQRALEKIMGDVPIGRLIEPGEIASLAGELFRNEALTGDVYFIHGGLRLGSRG